MIGLLSPTTKMASENYFRCWNTVNFTDQNQQKQNTASSWPTLSHEEMGAYIDYVSRFQTGQARLIFLRLHNRHGRRSMECKII